MRIGELAKAVSVILQTVRYYERQGLLPKAPRTASGYRLFATDTVRRIDFIKRAQDLGFSLNEIKELLSFHPDSETACRDVRRLAQAHIAEIDAKIRSLKSMRRVLARLAEACPGQGSKLNCPILESLESEGRR